MTFEEMFAQAKTALEKADASAVTEHIAVQVNVTGEGAGIFYTELTEGKLVAEPYDYIDNDAVLFTDGKSLLDNLKSGDASAHQLAGNEEKIALFRQVLTTIPVAKAATKPATKATTTKAAPAKKADTKTAAAKPAATPAKSAAKAPAAKSAAPAKKATTTRGAKRK
jgi:hypothetical protein